MCVEFKLTHSFLFSQKLDMKTVVIQIVTSKLKKARENDRVIHDWLWLKHCKAKAQYQLEELRYEWKQIKTYICAQIQTSHSTDKGDSLDFWTSNSTGA